MCYGEYMGDLWVCKTAYYVPDGVGLLYGSELNGWKYLIHTQWRINFLPFLFYFHSLVVSPYSFSLTLFVCHSLCLDCWQNCPSGFNDIGCFCEKPPTYSVATYLDPTHCENDNGKGKGVQQFSLLSLSLSSLESHYSLSIFFSFLSRKLQGMWPPLLSEMSQGVPWGCLLGLQV